MIFITGDTHCPIDIDKLSVQNFPQQDHMTKNDFLIITGDFGAIWDGSEEDIRWQNWFKSKNFTTLFVDGNHENFNLLNRFPVSTWNGGNVHFINDSIIHLMRGQVFTIDGFKFFTMGGARSTDRFHRTEGLDWWRQELPSFTDFNEAIDNLDKHHWKVDFVITHTACDDVISTISFIKESETDLSKFFDMLEARLKFRHWFFGHFHKDEMIDGWHTVMFNQFVRIEPGD